MFERYKVWLSVFSTLFGWLFTAYFIYLFFLYLWSTFEYLFPKASFFLALVITSMAVGALGWYYFFFRKGEEE
jgi:hypothetical protein